MQERIDVADLFFATTEDGKDYLSADFKWYVDLTEAETMVLQHYLKGIQDLLLGSLERVEQEQEGEQK